MIRQVIRTLEELAELPVGSVVMTLWDSRALHYVMQRHSDGWFGFPSTTALYPLGSSAAGAVLVLWNPDIETEPT